MITAETLKRLELHKILSAVAQLSHSDLTSKQIMAIMPSTDLESIRLISEQIEELRKLLKHGIQLSLSKFEDIRPLLDALRPADRSLAPLELLVFIPVLQAFSTISRQLERRNDISKLRLITPQLKAFPEILEPLSASIDDEGSILDAASRELREIRRAKRSLTARIRKKIDQIIRDNNIEIFLQDDFITQRSGRWVIPVRMDSKGMVRGVVHDVSASGETAFMEPLEIIPFVNELENLTAEEKGEELRVLRQLSAWIREDAAELEGCFNTLLRLDMLNSIAVFSENYQLETPHINEIGELRLCQARHPILLMLQKERKISAVEALDLEISADKSVMVITGPNAGGKTIALKTAGVLSLMALCSLPVPAEGAGSSFPLLDTILVDIGDEQSIEESLSTFSAHVARIATILDQASRRTLVLLDELGAGTEPQQGAAIACGVLQDLQERGATVIATTHLSEIIGFVHHSEAMINAGMEYNSETYTPLYRLISGEPGHSHAIEIARRYGMPERVIAFAKNMLGNAGSEFTSLLAELRNSRAELLEKSKALLHQQEILRVKEQELEQKTKAIELAKREASDKAWVEARELISATKRRMNLLLEEYRREKRSETIDKLRESGDRLTKALKPEERHERVGLKTELLKAGDTVHISTLGHDGTVLSVDHKNAKVRIASGSIELDVKFTDLASALHARRSAAVKSVQTLWQLEEPAVGEYELKLIGLRVDEALDLLEPFLNQALIKNINELRVVHGIGTGRLRDAVREYLGRHPLVKSWRSGAPHEGRDGATVVTLHY